MRKVVLKGIFLIFIPVIFFFQTTAMASENNIQSSTDPFLAAQSLGLNNYNFGDASIGGEYDSLLGMIFNTRYTHQFNKNFAIGAIGEYGPNQYRLSGTVGHTLWTDGQIKLTSEYLSQNLPFEFDSGNIDQRVHQSAYGFELRQNLHQNIFQNFSLGGYRAQSPNVSLANVTFVSDDFYYTNQRNIAGAVSQGVNVGTDLKLTSCTELSTQLFYDDVHYNTQFTENSDENSSRLGSALSLEQILSERLKFSLKREARAIDNTYRGEVAWVPESTQSFGAQFSLFAQRLISTNTMPNSNSYGLNVTLLSDENTHAPNYTCAPSDNMTSIGEWVKTPAVYMDRVLSIAEQKTTLNAPTITSFSPDHGPVDGGTLVTFNGTNFSSGATVAFNGVEGEVTSTSPTQINMLVPPLEPEAGGLTAKRGLTAVNIIPVDVVVKNTPDQETTLEHAYIYTTKDAPVLTSISPNTGKTSGGTSVTLRGSKLIDATQVSFDGVAAPSIHVESKNEITAITPAHDAGAVTVGVITPNGTSTLENAYTYGSAPALTNVSPNTGTLSGGQTVTLQGSYFTGTTQVTFDSVAATNVHVVNANEVTVTAPAHASAEAVNVSITTPYGTSTLANGYVYGNNTPALTSISPPVGLTSGGLTVTLHGTDLDAATQVSFGGVAATNVSVINGNEVTAITPAHAAGVVDVSLMTPHGSSTLSHGFTYGVAPSITSISPALGPLSGGAQVTINGSGFLSTTAVKFGTIPAQSYTINSNTSITAAAPSETAGIVDINVTTPFGTSPSTPANQYTYTSAPILTAVTPNMTLPQNFSTFVTFSGGALTGAREGHAQCTNGVIIRVVHLIVQNDTTAMAYLNNHFTLGQKATCQIRLLTPHGVTNPITFTLGYHKPILTGISPNEGPRVGGNRVTLTGSNLLPFSEITFGGHSIARLISVSGNTLVVVAPQHTVGTVDVVITTPGGTSTLTNAYTYTIAPTLTNASPKT